MHEQTNDFFCFTPIFFTNFHLIQIFYFITAQQNILFLKSVGTIDDANENIDF